MHSEFTKVKCPVSPSLEASDKEQGAEQNNFSPEKDASPLAANSGNTGGEGQNPNVDTECDHLNIAVEQEKASTISGDSSKDDPKEHHSPNVCVEQAPYEGDLPKVEKEPQQCDAISETVVFASGSQACDAVMQECRVNLRRIPYSPESTR